MSVVTSSVGLASGIDTGAIIDALIGAQRGTITRLTNRRLGFEAEASGLTALQQFTLSINTAAERLGNPETYDAVRVRSSDADALAVSAEPGATAGSTVYTPVRQSSTHAAVTAGFAGPSAAVGTGELVLSDRPGVRGETPLDLLNGGAGVRRGEVRVTDSAGNVARVDLAGARTTRDVLNAFNNAEGVALNARVEGVGFVLEDLSDPNGTGTITVADLAGGTTAADLGLAGTGAGKVAGDEVYAVAEAFTFGLLDDGIGLRTAGDDPDGEPRNDLGIELADGTTFEVDLDGDRTVGGVVAAINDHASNGGKLTAELAGGRLVLTDRTDPPQVPDPDNPGNPLLGTPPGTKEADTELTLTELNGADVLRGLGLTTAVERDVDGAGGDDRLTGARLLAGLDSVLLRNLGGPDGIAGGQIRVRDRAGNASNLDLTGAESLDEVVAAINDAGTGVRAAVTDAGLTLSDASGGTGLLKIIDQEGTLAADLGIVGEYGSNAVTGEPVARRSVGRATALESFAAGPVAGGVTVTDSAGVSFTAELGAAATVGDVLDLFNTAADDANAGVRAELNDTGDGFRLVDTAGGAGELAVAGGLAVDSLRLGGAVKDGVLSARDATIIEIGEDDTLEDLAAKLSAAGTGVSAQIVNDGTTLASSRLALTSDASGAARRFRIDDRGLTFADGRSSLGLRTSVRGEDALLAVGADAAGGFLLADADGSFDGLPGGAGVTIKRATGEPVTVTVSRDDSGVTDALKNFVASYNNLADLAGDLTESNGETGERGVLAGNPTVGRILRRTGSLLTRRFGPPRVPGAGGEEETVRPRTLFDLGVREGKDGRISLNADRLADALAADPAAVADFFRDPDAGFAQAAQDAMDTLNDPFNGLIERETDALEARGEQIVGRVATLEARLLLKRDRLVRQFAAMESAIAGINSSQTALAALRPLNADGTSQ